MDGLAGLRGQLKSACKIPAGPVQQAQLGDVLQDYLSILHPPGPEAEEEHALALALVVTWQKEKHCRWV